MDLPKRIWFQSPSGDFLVARDDEGLPQAPVAVCFIPPRGIFWLLGKYTGVDCSDEQAAFQSHSGDFLVASATLGGFG